MRAAGSGKRQRRRPGRRRAARDGGAPWRAVRAELLCLPPRAYGFDSQTEPFEGRGIPKRKCDYIDDIKSNKETPGILDESCCLRRALPAIHKPPTNWNRAQLRELRAVVSAPKFVLPLTLCPCLWLLSLFMKPDLGKHKRSYLASGVLLVKFPV